jgi:hypothetical protein
MIAQESIRSGSQSSDNAAIGLPEAGEPDTPA